MLAGPATAHADEVDWAQPLVCEVDAEVAFVVDAGHGYELEVHAVAAASHDGAVALDRLASSSPLGIDLYWMVPTDPAPRRTHHLRVHWLTSPTLPLRQAVRMPTPTPTWSRDVDGSLFGAVRVQSMAVGFRCAGPAGDPPHGELCDAQIRGMFWTTRPWPDGDATGGEPVAVPEEEDVKALVDSSTR